MASTHNSTSHICAVGSDPVLAVVGDSGGVGGVAVDHQVLLAQFRALLFLDDHLFIEQPAVVALQDGRHRKINHRQSHTKSLPGGHEGEIGRKAPHE
jgi:hypothetical protein